jgi:cell wall assembly regulator SMI1
MANKDVVKQIAQAYNQLPKEELQKYKDMAEEDKLRYVKEMQVWTEWCRKNGRSVDEGKLSKKAAQKVSFKPVVVQQPLSFPQRSSSPAHGNEVLL